MKKAIVVASIHEATPLIKELNLKKIDSKFGIYKNKEYTLIISGIGKLNSAIATSHILSIDKFDTILNFGVAGAKSDIEIGSIHLANKVIDNDIKKEYYPDILLSHNLNEVDITTFDTPVSSTDDFCTSLVDMECSAFFFSASKFLSPCKISAIKIVSDHCEPSSINKEFVNSIISNHIDKVIEYLDNYHYTTVEILNSTQKSIIDNIANNLQLSFNQKVQLEDKAKYLVLNESFDRVLEFENIKTKSKQEAKVEFTKIKKL
jgi:nucleoside phosphorylase